MPDTETTAYDRVAYPTALFAQSQPERLAVLATLAGLEPVDPRKARILEIGGGDCMNLIAMAAAWPDADCHGFDLSQVAIAKGQATIDKAGIANVTLVVDDILTAHERYADGSFDYVIAHGVYAWVPPHVREACMTLIARLLSPSGIGYVSYNCMPGGHVRMIMREMLLQEVGQITDPEEKLAKTKTVLEDYANAADNDDHLQRFLRLQAQDMLERPQAVLFHDELGDCFFPQRLADVVAEGEYNGLKFLTDSGRNRQLDGFLAPGQKPEEDADAQVLQSAIRDDYVAIRYFRQTLFVRESQQLERKLDVQRMWDLWLSTKIKRNEDGSFAAGDDEIEIKNTQLADALEAASNAFPRRTPLSEIAKDKDDLEVILRLFNEWYVNLHPFAAQFVDGPGDHPMTSPLVRAMMELGEETICTLNHNLLKVEQPELRNLLLAADGTKTLPELAEAGHGIPPEQVGDALKASAGQALLSA